MRNLDKIKQLTSHPLEDVLGIEENTTEVIRYERNTELLEYDPFDDKEKEIEKQYQEIADLAINSYKKLDEITENADTKLVARLTEVKMQSLNMALGALEKRARLKETKDRAIAKADAVKQKGNTTNQAVFIMDRNQMLSMMRDKLESPEDGQEIIEGEIMQEDSGNQNK